MSAFLLIMLLFSLLNFKEAFKEYILIDNSENKFVLWMWIIMSIGLILTLMFKEYLDV